ncbi:MAG: aminomethyl-transferring glycine dehydrogenase subunit GcvPA [Sphaerochaetaceae bacterium]|nr:aminomethyl-transferring glycine dehydrogenase subunit GcvPA [Sphaerochaetaceae bacterium]MDC7237803.1 aminomethyl-transferring glycine dehydrogenase subunit GcvPA [Sphaerochaetaceae bacterium]
MSYVVTSEKEKKQMLEEIGISSIEELYKDIPKEVFLTEPLNLEEGKSEFEVLAEMRKIAQKNVIFDSTFRGAGSYRHLIPEVVKHLSSLSGFATSYTPYQAEISQGNLQSIFEYQSEICNLCDLEVSNSSIYDGASASCEALVMSLKRDKNKVLISKAIHPNYIDAIKAYAFARDIRIEEIDIEEGLTSLDNLKKKDLESVSSIIVQSPNFYGLIEDVESISTFSKDNKLECVEIVNPISLGMLKTPGEMGVELACGEAQPLGLDQGFGGPYLGFIAASNKYLRKIPGRIVGQTTDVNDKEAYVLTLQAREQHIRREKASSSICSNQALSALRCAIYMAAMGKQGIKEVAKRSFNNAHYAMEQITNIDGFSRKWKGEFFHEFVIDTKVDVDLINKALKENNIEGPYKLGKNEMLVCLTEALSKTEIDKFIDILRQVKK